MNFNFTEEEAKTPVTYGDLSVFLNEIVKVIEEGKKTEHETIELVLQSLADILAKRINEVQYDRMRDAKFFISLFRDLGLVSQDYLEKYYTKWCVEFDKLNKGVLNDESKTNC